MTPQEFESCVLLASDVSSQQQQWDATSRLSEWVSQDPSTVASVLLETIPTTSHERVQFYALTTIQRREILISTSLQQRVQLREYLLTSSGGELYLLTKRGVVLASLILMDFPNSWPDAFDHLLQQTSPDLYLRTLDVLLEDLDQNPTNEAYKLVKDVIRGYYGSSPLPVEQTITAHLMERLLMLLAQSLQQNAPHISILTLSVWKRFMSWVDVTLVLADAAQKLLFACLHAHSYEIGVLAVECWHELMGRGMEPEKKVALLIQTELLGKLHAHVNLETVDASPIEVVIQVAKLIDTAGQELLPLITEQTSSPDPGLYALWNQLLDLFFRCFSYDDIDVSGAVVPLASQLATNSAPANSSGSGSPQILSRIMAILYRQMRYPLDHRFDHDDDDEAEEEVYRSELRKLYVRLVRTCPEMCLQFLCEALSNLPVPISASPMPDVEAALRLVFHYCEGIRPPPGMKVVMKNETFCSILVALHGNSDITSHPHREVLLLYYDVAVRYYPIFVRQPELLPTLLQGLSGSRGLQHSHPRVRSRSCYLLLRLVKSVVKVLRPYVETAVTGIQGLLSNLTEESLRPDDVLYLFETIGLLLGKTGLSPLEQQQSLVRIMAPHIRSMETTLQSEHFTRDQEYFGTILAGSIAAIAYLTKGFHKPPTQVQVVLMETVSITLAVLEALPGNDAIRSKSMIFLQRMILCVGPGILPKIPPFITVLIDHCDVNDFQDVAQLLVQLCIKFKQEAAIALDPALLPFLRKCHSLIPSEEEVITQNIPPHLRTEQLSIQKLSFTVLQHIVSYKATAVLVSPTNATSFESVLRTMKDGSVAVEDPVVKKACIAFFRELCDQWLDKDMANSSGSTLTNGFVRFLRETYIPDMLKCLLEPTFNEQDAMQARNISEFAQIVASLKTKSNSEEFDRYVIQGTLLSLGCSPSLLEAFRSASAASEMVMCLKEMIKMLKPKNPQ